MFNKIILLFLLLSLQTDALNSETVIPNILKKGTLDNDLILDNTTIKNDQELGEIKKIIKDSSLGSHVDFSRELLFLVSARDRNATDIKIDRIEKKLGDTLYITYTVEESKNIQLGKLGIAKYPYLIGSIDNSEVKINEVAFRENMKVSPIPSGTALDDDLKYSNVLTTYQNLEILEYIPLDVGNRWSYEIEKGSNTSRITQEVQSVSNGWSILNTYFGKPNIAMKIDVQGDLYVSSQGGGARTFYDDSVTKTFVSEEVVTPAGSFRDLMIVTIPENDNFWFKDVYAKGVGLVYHEHKSPKGSGKYTLINANVRGKSYPQ